jgi:salicylate hydroxylase
MTTSNLHVAIVGAGIGGLACAIACRRQSPPIDVTLIERAPEILTIGAGIHIPPNACRVVTYLGVLDKLRAAGGYFLQGFTLRRYSTGAELATKPMGERMVREYGAGWM